MSFLLSAKYPGITLLILCPKGIKEIKIHSKQKIARRCLFTCLLYLDLFNFLVTYENISVLDRGMIIVFGCVTYRSALFLTNWTENIVWHEKKNVLVEDSIVVSELKKYHAKIINQRSKIKSKTTKLKNNLFTIVIIHMPCNCFSMYYCFCVLKLVSVRLITHLKCHDSKFNLFLVYIIRCCITL